MAVIQVVNGLIYSDLDLQSGKEFNNMCNIISEHLSEPYSIYVYWYFLNAPTKYCYTVKETEDSEEIIGIIISKVDYHRDVRKRGYIGMLVVDPKFRGKKIATTLIELSIRQMVKLDQVDEVTLETEVKNVPALKLYESLGFCRVKRLYKYYMNTDDAFRLILPITEKSCMRGSFLPPIKNTGSKVTNTNII